MSKAKVTQCLLFFVHELKQSIATTGRSVTSFSSMKFYALLPEVFKSEHPEVLKLFTDNSIVIISDSDDSSLQFVGRGEFEIIEMLMEINPATGDNISFIVEYADLNIVEKLIFSKTVVNLKAHYSVADEVYPAVNDDNVAVMKRILSKKADVCCKHPPEESLLQLAARRGHEILVGAILEHTVDINSKWKDGSTPLYAAVEGGHSAIVNILLKKGADIASRTSDDSTALQVAVVKGYADIVQILLQNGADGDCKTNSGLTFLLTAIDSDHQDVVDILLQNGVDIHARTDYGATPVHLAVHKGLRDIVELLLWNGADIDCRDSEGRTPLLLAVRNGCFEIVKVLLNFGARVDILDFHKVSVLDEAYEGMYPLIARLLLESCFLDPGTLDKIGAFRFPYNIPEYRRWTSSRKSPWFSLTHNLVKILAANIYLLVLDDLLPAFLDLEGELLTDLKTECKSEVAKMVEQCVGGSDISFFDILIKDVSQVARYVKDTTVSQSLSSDSLYDDFPNYAGILRCQFEKGRQRRLALEVGVELVCKVSSLFDKLPLEVREIILDHLSLKDLLNLKSARAHTNP